MTAKPYYFIYFLDTDHPPHKNDIFIHLYPAGYLVIGEGEWPQLESSHSYSNAYFSFDDAKEALVKIALILNSETNFSSKFTSSDLREISRN